MMELLKPVRDEKGVGSRLWVERGISGWYQDSAVVVPRKSLMSDFKAFSERHYLFHS